ncbi:ferredoxin [Amycolatopsis rhabdoformis]|uniref:Ferredoxin n=1 Tax=Amycolatopsis rhabdoformis TaxID=1448059 RepID=A0ABZ1IJC6_9PSEU|nr:ferredoxin [Amycolatopsis rhabdoformis]WSE34284.1 ferredoxin [Amycolatopsis rhabdoformis]
MNVEVDPGLCESHGQCEFAAPEVFSLDDDAVLHIDLGPVESQREAVHRAARACPTRAIRIAE